MTLSDQEIISQQKYFNMQLHHSTGSKKWFLSRWRLCN